MKADSQEGMLQDARCERRALRMIESSKVVSLDVFDTLLTRSCGGPDALFLWLGRRLCRMGALSCTPEVFARVRRSGEELVWQREGGLDSAADLEDFYTEVARMLCLNRESIKVFVKEEIALEEAVLEPTRQGRTLIKVAESIGAQIVFTSDTYLPSEVIKRILTSHRLWPEGARCFASCEHKKSKASGMLFEVIKEKVMVSPALITHLGDHPNSDVTAPRHAGLKAVWLNDGRLTRFEKILVDGGWETEGMSAALAGASRRARMSVPADSAHSRFLRDVAAGVAGPFLTAYVLWILRRTMELNIKRLFFVSRDGQVLADIARILAPRLGMNVECRYLFASRQTVNLAAVYDRKMILIEWGLRENASGKLGDVLATMGLEVDEVADELASIGVNGVSGNTRVTKALAERIAWGMGSGVLWNKVMEKAQSRREVVERYMRQEGMLDGTRCGIVDLGGTGSQLRALHELCCRNGQPSPRQFAVGLEAYLNKGYREAVAEESWLDNTECFLFDLQRRRGIVPFRGLRTAFQMFCAADHGTVLGYRELQGVIHPVTRDNGCHQEIVAWGLPVVRRTLLEFAEKLIVERDVVNPGAFLGQVVCDVVEEFMKRPSPGEARAWGAFPFESGVGEFSEAKCVARPYTLRRLVRVAKRPSLIQETWHSWHEADVALSSLAMRTFIRFAERLYSATKRSARWRYNRVLGVAIRRWRHFGERKETGI